MPGYNKVIAVEDFADPAIVSAIGDVFAHERELFTPDAQPFDSRQWEIAMAVRALRDGGCLTRQSRILGVGAATEAIGYYLTRHAREVVATDRYSNWHSHADAAPLAFLTNPRGFSRFDYEEDRLIPLYMDPRVLRFSSESFDGVYACGSMERLGAADAVANAAYEIGRVLRPGGIASISTQLQIAGPDEDPDLLLFTAEKLRKYIVEASGLEPVDELDLNTSEATLSQRRDLSPLVEGASPSAIAPYPSLILYRGGRLHCAVHLALRKPHRYPIADNAWAAPGPSVREHVNRQEDRAVSYLGGTLLDQLHRTMHEREELAELRQRDAERAARLEQLQNFVNAQEVHLRALESVLESSRTRIADLEEQARAYRTLLDDREKALEEQRRIAAGLSQELETHRLALADARVVRDQILNSLSWKATAPLRSVLSLFK